METTPNMHVVSDTTPPSLRQQSASVAQLGANFKPLMNEMASFFPLLSPEVQEQARQANTHVQQLISAGLSDQAMGLLQHMRDVMAGLVAQRDKGEESEVRTGQVFFAVPEMVASPPFKAPATSLLAVPPLPPSTSPELLALRRSVEDLEMKMSESAAVTLIAKRVRDMELEQKYYQIEERLASLRRNVGDKLEHLKEMTGKVETLTKRELRKRTVSKNPFCQHESSGFCEFCVGRDEHVDYGDQGLMSESVLGGMSPSSRPPMLEGVRKEDLVNREMVMEMQQSLKRYQTTLKELLEQRKREIGSHTKAG